jgi:hypothetical protein
MRSAKPSRTRKDRRREIKTHSAKLFTKFPEMSACKPLWNILKEDQGGSTLIDDAHKVGEWCVIPAVAALIGVPSPLSGNGVWLARWTGNDDVCVPAQRSGVQAADTVAPKSRAM